MVSGGSVTTGASGPVVVPAFPVMGTIRQEITDFQHL